MLKFYLNEMMEIGLSNGCIEGTMIIKPKIDFFADNLVAKFLTNIQGEMVLLNISNLKNIFKESLIEFEKINSKVLNDIIT